MSTLLSKQAKTQHFSTIKNEAEMIAGYLVKKIISYSITAHQMQKWGERQNPHTSKFAFNLVDKLLSYQFLNYENDDLPSKEQPESVSVASTLTPKNNWSATDEPVGY